MVNEPQITITVAFISAIISIASLLLCMYILFNLQSQFRRKRNLTEDEQYRSKYFRNTSQLASISNVFCCISVTLYCTWIIFQSEQTLLWLITLRALPTIFWFLAKSSLIWIYNGRYYYTFQTGIFRRAASSRYLFIAINTIITIAAPLCLMCGYMGVWYSDPMLISFGFEGYRFLYILLTFGLLFLFSKKMLMIQNQSFSDFAEYSAVPAGSRDVTAETDGETDTESSDHVVSIQLTRNTLKELQASQEQEMLFFLHTTTRNAVLVLFISISACFVAFWWTAFDFILGQNYLTLLVPLNMFAVDCLIDLLCICLMFQFGTPMYHRICRSCDTCCKQCLFCVCIRTYTPEL
eukprot:140764_1